MTIQLDEYRQQPAVASGDQLVIGDEHIHAEAMIDGGAAIGAVQTRAVMRAAARYERLTGGHCRPQLAALVFDATHDVRALYHYFPIANILAENERAQFNARVQALAEHRHLDVRLIGERRADLTAQLPASARSLIAGHLIEIFFYRADILERFVSAPRHFLLYPTPRAFQDDGGQAGGQYHADREAVQLVLARLYEGFNQRTPGVAPFLHEFGHMLDFFDAGRGTMGESNGLLPGLSPGDGAAYTPRARERFLRGKRLELERYLALYHGTARPVDPLPIGHPYVFQNDTEFCAGYFEMFFRNPHYFAAQNPDLFAAYAELFGYDTRRAWPEDFPFYVDENRKFYLSGQKPWTPGITVPES
jgi:hypothetical protein